MRQQFRVFSPFVRRVFNRVPHGAARHQGNEKSAGGEDAANELELEAGLSTERSLLAVMMAATASAQTSVGAIRGTVSDPSGAAVPGAGIIIEAVSSSAGLYDAPNLPVGRYKMTVKALGFSTAERTYIDV